MSQVTRRSFYWQQYRRIVCDGTRTFLDYAYYNNTLFYDSPDMYIRTDDESGRATNNAFRLEATRTSAESTM